MSGNAALSAARKRRASSSPNMFGGVGGVGGVSTSSGTGRGAGTGGSYYSVNNIQNIQSMLSQPPPPPQPPVNANTRQSPRGSNVITYPTNDGTQIPLNIYENIELIRQQIDQRTNIIKTQGATMPPEKLKILYKQNEVQIQILKQRMLMVQDMEMAAAANTQASVPKAPIQGPAQAQASAPAPPVNMKGNSVPEPQFIYEKGIPRPNPRYNPGGNNNTNNSNNVVASTEKQVSFAPTIPNTSHSTSTNPTSKSAKYSPIARLTPFVSMLTNTGASPPPLVILKSHDEKIGEHDAVLHDFTNRLNYIQSCVDDLSENTSGSGNKQLDRRSSAVPKNAVDSYGAGATHNDEDEHDADDDVDADDDDGDETVLLMDTVMNDLINSRDFVQGIVDKIVNETNLSETILKVEPIIKENQELRSLIHSQQKMLNEMNTMVLRLLNQNQQLHHEYTTTTTITTDSECDINTYEESHHDHDHDHDDTENNNNTSETHLNSDGLYETDEQPIFPTQCYIVPNMDNVVMTVVDSTVIEEEEENVDNSLPTGTEEEIVLTDDNDETDVNESTHDYDDNSTPHFPSSETHIALVVNEIEHKSN